MDNFNFLLLFFPGRQMSTSERNSNEEALQVIALPTNHWQAPRCKVCLKNKPVKRFPVFSFLVCCSSCTASPWNSVACVSLFCWLLSASFASYYTPVFPTLPHVSDTSVSLSSSSLGVPVYPYAFAPVKAIQPFKQFRTGKYEIYRAISRIFKIL